VHEVQVDVVCLQVLQRGCDALVDALVPGVIELGGDPDLLAGNARVNDALADLCLVAIRKGAESLSGT
jgi:hypothetical protein